MRLIGPKMKGFAAIVLLPLDGTGRSFGDETLL